MLEPACQEKGTFLMMMLCMYSRPREQLEVPGVAEQATQLRPITQRRLGAQTEVQDGQGRRLRRRPVG